MNASEDIDTLAAGWFARQRSGQMTPAERCELELWLARAAAHREALAVAQAAWQRLEAIRSDPRILAMREMHSGRRGWHRKWPMKFLAAASVAGLAVLVTWFGFKPLVAYLTPPVEQELRTNVGQTAVAKLPDGTIVTLDTDTVLRTSETRDERRLTVEKGQAFFRVAHDPSRPFKVAAAGKTVIAIGTAFGVRLDAQQMKVTLVEGRVRVEAPATGNGIRPQMTEMTAGSQLVVSDDRHWTLSVIDGRTATSWLHGVLTFEAQPLSTVVADMNRYSMRHIVIEDPRLAATELSGTYRAGDIEGFVAALEAYGIARVGSSTPARVELVPPRSR